MKLQAVGELALIKRLSKLTRKSSKEVLCGIGDDTAVLKIKNKTLLWTTDMLIEDVHFSKKTPLALVGQKAVNRNVSDIAAMGGVPRWALVNLAVPKSLSVRQFDELNRAIFKTCHKYGVEVIGGDLSASGKIYIAITLMGGASKQVRYRSGAQAGDAIFVTGTLGGSILGKHLKFIPRLKEAQFLAPHVTSMIDLSDGLLTDLKHILERSKKGAILDFNQIPISKDALLLSKKSKKPSLHHVLSDGEDYELLFTVKKSKVKKLERDFKRRFSLKLTKIGEITKYSESRLEKSYGFEHFK